MQTKLRALTRLISDKRNYCIAGVAALAVVCFLVLGVRAGASNITREGWVLSVDGVAVAGAATEAELTEAYEALVASYETEDTVSVEVLDRVTIEEGAYPDSLPQHEAIAGALAAEVDVRTVEETTRIETVELETVTVLDDTMYEDESYATPGRIGIQWVTTTTICRNGEEYIVREDCPDVEVEAVAEVVTVGTKVRPEYVWPAHGSYTGNFGTDTINGANRQHKGIDIAAGKGTNIYAARAGVVVYAGWNSGGYGKLIIIEHDNGTQTYYAHNSQILVSVGDTVAQGQHIGEMGSTGRVTGVHCHFELRVGEYTGLYSGTPVDPLDYLNWEDF